MTHPHLQRHLRRLGLSDDFASVTPQGWERLLDRISRSYADADQERYLVERSMQVASNEMATLHHDLAAAAARYTDFFNDAPAVYVVTRIEGDQHVIADCNEWTTRILGYTREELLGQPISLLCHHEQGVALSAVFCTMACQIYTSAGDPIDAIVRGVPERNPGGGIIGARIMFLDLSSQQQLLEAQRASQAKSEFLSRMSHELRTPMNAVLGFAQLLELDELADEQREHLAHIMTAGRHLLGLIDEILDISRIEARRMDLRAETFDVPALIAEVVQMLAPQADAACVDVTASPDTPDAAAWADPQRAKQVLLNLVSNAIKYNRQGGTVSISIETPGDARLRILVSDSGPGIAPANLPRLFEPFNRLGAERTSVPGTGLGLALSRLLAEAMNGTLSAASTEGAGSTFTFELPLAARRDDGLHDHERAA